MEVAINYTVYLEALTEYDEMAEYIIQRHISTIKELEYELLYSVCGIHRNAKRIHIHYHTINKIPEDTKKYKALNAKLKSLNSYNYIIPYKNFKVPPVNITFKYSDEEKYDINKVLMYPLKEYENNQIMNDEVITFRVGKDQLEKLRREAHLMYSESIKDELLKKAKQMERTQQKKDLYSYLDININLNEIPEGYGNIEYIAKYTIKRVLQYYKNNNKNFSIHQLKNTAINYLYFKDKISEQNIIDYINI